MNVAAFTVGMAALLAACAPPSRTPVSEFNVADVSHSHQLISGFYDVEQGRSRWAARQFSVALRPPSNAARRGARLRLRFFVPGQQIEDIGPMTLYAEVDGYRLEPQVFYAGGFHDYVRDIPSDILDTNIIPVRFAFDRASPPGTADARELGAVISEVGLRPR